MKKLIFSTLISFLSISLSAAEPGTAWFPLAGQNAQWTVTGTGAAEKLNFDGTVVAGTAIATNFGGLTPPYTGLSLKFRTTVSTDAAQSTVIVLGSNAAWGGQGIVLDITKERIFACKNFVYFDPFPTLVAVKLSSNEAEYQAAIASGVTPYTFIVDVSATGLITVTANGVVCATSYQPDAEGVNLLNTNTFILFAPGFTGYKLRDVVAKRDGIAKSYFPTVAYTIAASSNDAAKGSVTGSGDYQTTSDVTLTAIPTAGNIFVKWTDGGVDYSTANPLVFQASVAKTLVAVFDVSTSVSKMNDVKFSVYPTSGNGIFTVSNAKVGQAYRITNLTGQLVQSGVIKSVNQQLNISNSSAGIYFISTKVNDKMCIERIVKN